MQKYKDPSDKVYEISPDYKHMLPPGCVEISEEEAARLLVAAAPRLATSQDNRRTELRADCRAAITGLFSSSALGAAHTYDCRIEDQGNIRMRQAASIVDLAARKIWAHDGVEFTREPHTTAQLDQVILDMEAHIEAQQGRLETKIAMVNAVGTGDDAADAVTIAAITW